MENAMNLDAVQQEQLAAQVVAVMAAVFGRPSPNEMRHVLRLAEQQVGAYEHNALDSAPTVFRAIS